MKKQLLLPIFLITLLVSCKNETPAQPETPKAPEAPAPAVAETPPALVKTECYNYDVKQNKIELHLDTYDNNEIKGTLSYDLFEKDKNTGTITGKIENNILLADYVFNSEGRQSTRQIAFQVKGDQMIGGYGELTPDGTKFKDATKLTFNPVMALKKIECPK